MDPQKILTDKGREIITDSLSKLTKKFPQIKPTFCTLSLNQNQDPRLIGFLMVNKAPLGEGESTNDRTWQLLILADQSHQRLSITTGYSIEPYLPDSELRTIADRVKRAYFKGEIESAMGELFKGLKKTLNESHQKSKKVIRLSK